MDNSENSNKSRIDEYRELAQNSLVRVQYSCGGNSTSIDEPEKVPIVSDQQEPLSTVLCTPEREEDAEEFK